MEDGCRFPSAWVRIVINFTNRAAAAITGDFVLVAQEVNPVLKALRDAIE